MLERLATTVHDSRAPTTNAPSRSTWATWPPQRTPRAVRTNLPAGPRHGADRLHSGPERPPSPPRPPALVQASSRGRRPKPTLLKIVNSLFAPIDQDTFQRPHIAAHSEPEQVFRRWLADYGLMADADEALAADYDGLFYDDALTNGGAINQRATAHLLQRIGPTSAVQDAACGTGIDAAVLAGRGFTVWAADGSDAMADGAAARFRREQLAIPLLRSRWADLAAIITPPRHAVLRSLEFSPAGQSIARDQRRHQDLPVGDRDRQARGGLSPTPGGRTSAHWPTAPTDAPWPSPTAGAGSSCGTSAAALSRLPGPGRRHVLPRPAGPETVACGWPVRRPHQNRLGQQPSSARTPSGQAVSAPERPGRRAFVP